ncbi:MAG: iron ABC transporter permease [Spirochaetaceae bacterium]|jgi:iron complex transport system permease protein|nr:iron ABC transporter permease [Spirochaetaceae bacterium]
MTGNRSAAFAGKAIAFSAVMLAGFLASFLVGRYGIPLKTIVDILLSRLTRALPYWDQTIETVILRVRLPRILLAIMVGGALSLSGASYQTLFKNPMVSPDILGVSAGAGFGAALAMIYRASWWEIQLCAFVFGITAVLVSWGISYLFGRQEITILILAGIVVSSLFQALLSIIKTLADTENALPSITFWLMGSLGRAAGREVFFMLPAMAVSCGLLFFFRYHIDALSAGEDEAAAMGVNVPVVKAAVIVSSTLMTVSSVSICGIIGWVGLVVPHVARMLVGASFSRLSLMSLLIGGSFLLLIDDAVRGIEGVDLPLGVLTALVGTPVFVALLSRIRKGWS